jgi:hypothetical protein
MLNPALPQRTGFGFTAAVLTSAAAALTGVLAVSSGRLAFLPLAVSVGLALIALDRRATSVFLTALAILLAGYAFAGRGFAYLGAAPIYVSEAVLGFAVVALLVNLREGRLSGLHVLLMLFMALGAARTIPYLERDGLVALRDAVVWIYALFAISISFVIRQDQIQAVSGWFARLAPLFVLWAPVLFILYEVFGSYLPLAPGSRDATIPYFNPGDIAVHLAGVAAFVLVGLYRRHNQVSPPQMLLLGTVWVIGFIMCASLSRGAFLAGFLALCGVFLLRPSRAWLPFAALAASVLLLVLLINPSFRIEGRDRDVSPGSCCATLQASSAGPAMALWSQLGAGGLPGGKRSSITQSEDLTSGKARDSA